MRLPPYIGKYFLNVKGRRSRDDVYDKCANAILRQSGLYPSIFVSAAHLEIAETEDYANLVYQQTICKMVSEDNLQEAAIQWIAFYLFVDAVASEVEDNEADECLTSNRKLFVHSGEDICETVPDALDELEISIKDYIGSCIETAAKIVEFYDKRWEGVDSVAELYKYFEEGFLCDLALGAIGHGVFPEDDPDVKDRFDQLRIDSNGAYFDSPDVYNVIQAIKEKLEADE